MHNSIHSGRGTHKVNMLLLLWSKTGRSLLKTPVKSSPEKSLRAAINNAQDLLIYRDVLPPEI